jgi:hypothetical protein
VQALSSSPSILEIKVEYENHNCFGAMILKLYKNGNFPFIKVNMLLIKYP